MKICGLFWEYVNNCVFVVLSIPLLLSASCDSSAPPEFYGTVDIALDNFSSSEQKYLHKNGHWNKVKRSRRLVVRYLYVYTNKNFNI